MSREMLHILEQERGGPMVFQNSLDLEEQISLLLVLKAVQPTERILLGDAGK